MKETNFLTNHIIFNRLQKLFLYDFIKLLQLYDIIYKNCLIQVEPIIQPVSSPTNAIVPMDYQYVSPAVVETPAFIPYVNENIK